MADQCHIPSGSHCEIPCGCFGGTDWCSTGNELCGYACPLSDSVLCWIQWPPIGACFRRVDNNLGGGSVSSVDSPSGGPILNSAVGSASAQIPTVTGNSYRASNANLRNGDGATAQQQLPHLTTFEIMCCGSLPVMGKLFGNGSLPVMGKLFDNCRCVVIDDIGDGKVRQMEGHCCPFCCGECQPEVWTKS